MGTEEDLKAIVEQHQRDNGFYYKPTSVRALANIWHDYVQKIEFYNSPAAFFTTKRFTSAFDAAFKVWTDTTTWEAFRVLRTLE